MKKSCFLKNLLSEYFPSYFHSSGINWYFLNSISFFIFTSLLYSKRKLFFLFSYQQKLPNFHPPMLRKRRKKERNIKRPFIVSSQSDTKNKIKESPTRRLCFELSRDWYNFPGERGLEKMCHEPSICVRNFEGIQRNPSCVTLSHV